MQGRLNIRDPRSAPNSRPSGIGPDCAAALVMGISRSDDVLGVGSGLTAYR